MTFDRIERKIERPPAAHNVAGLLDPSCEIKTTHNIARFAVSIPAFNYVSGMTVCKDRVALGINLETGLTAVEHSGSPAGRAQNASLVRAFFEYDKQRGYSKLRVIDGYEGHFKISRKIWVPTVPTFTVLEHGKQVPVVVCGWKKFSLRKDQIRAWLTMLDSGLFSYADYRKSPWEVLILPESQDEGERSAVRIRPGEYELFSERDMRELAAMYARAQIAAMPLAREIWERREEKRRERERSDSFSTTPEIAPPMRDLFARDDDSN
jgi:hypothetical protein